MSPNREHNFCCNAGGGLAAISNWAAHKARGNRVKGEQIKETGASAVITPCHNCSTGIKDVIKYWNLGVKNIFFDEILVATMEIPEDKKAIKE
jgi:Fe-S oxidoreductase